MNAERVEALGAGQVIDAEASPDEIRAALVEVLEDDRYRSGARRMADVVAGYGQGARAIEELERLIVR